MKLKAAVFDLDGTILDTLMDLSIAVNYALKTCGYPVRSFEDIRQFVGNGALNLMKRALPGGYTEDELLRVLDLFNEYYEDHCEENTRPYEGITELIEELRDQGTATAVVSNKPDYGVQALCRRHFPGMFDIVIGQKEGIKIKPDPECLNSVMRELGSDKENTVYIGDSEVDIATGNNSGIKCILADWGFRDREVLEKAGAKIIVSSVDELRNELLG